MESSEDASLWFRKRQVVPGTGQRETGPGVVALQQLTLPECALFTSGQGAKPSFNPHNHPGFFLGSNILVNDYGN